MINFEQICELFYSALCQARPGLICDSYEVAYAKFDKANPKSWDAQTTLVDIAISHAYKLVMELNMDGIVPGTTRRKE